MKFIRYCRLIWSLLRSEDENKPQRRKRGNRRSRQRLVAPDRQKIHKTPDTPKIRAEEREERLRHNLRLVGLVAMGMSAAAVIFVAVRETVLKNPRLTVQEIYVTPSETPVMLTPSQIQAASGLHEGANLLSVNLRDVRDRLMLMPAISDVKVEHDFAGKITITPTQRVPVAWVKCEHLQWLPKRVSQGLLVDAEGRAIPAETMLPEYDALPVIVDDTIDQIKAGTPISSARFVAALQLMKMLVERQPRDGLILASIEAPNKFALVAHFSGGAKVTFSYDDIGPQLKRYDQFVVEAKAQKWKFRTLNLVAELNTPMTLEIAAVSKPEPKPEPKVTTRSSTRTPSTSSSRTSKGTPRNPRNNH